MKNAYFTMIIDPTSMPKDMTIISILWGDKYDRWKNNITNTGKTVIVKIDNRAIKLKIWKYKDSEIYLLDADISGNTEQDRLLTESLSKDYLKLKNTTEKEILSQEIILGIGGICTLKILNKIPDMFYFNDCNGIFAIHIIINYYIISGMTIQCAINIAKFITRFTRPLNDPIVNKKYDITTLIGYGANYCLDSETLNQIGGNPYCMTIGNLKKSGKITKVEKNTLEKTYFETDVELWKFKV